MTFDSTLFWGVVVPVFILLVVLIASGRLSLCKHEYECLPQGFNVHFTRYECKKCHKEVFKNKGQPPPRGFKKGANNKAS